MLLSPSPSPPPLSPASLNFFAASNHFLLFFPLLSTFSAVCVILYVVFRLPTCNGKVDAFLPEILSGVILR